MGPESLEANETSSNQFFVQASHCLTLEGPAGLHLSLGNLAERVFQNLPLSPPPACQPRRSNEAYRPSPQSRLLL